MKTSKKRYFRLLIPRSPKHSNSFFVLVMFQQSMDSSHSINPESGSENWRNSREKIQGVRSECGEILLPDFCHWSVGRNGLGSTVNISDYFWFSMGSSDAASNGTTFSGMTPEARTTETWGATSFHNSSLDAAVSAVDLGGAGVDSVIHKNKRLHQRT